MKHIFASVLVVTALARSVCACSPARAVEAQPVAPVATAPVAAVTASASPTATPPTATAPAALQTIEGELVDLACYLDHGAKGEKHRACATRCAQKGLPIGLLDKDDKITLVVGEHEKAMNNELAEKMGTTVRLTGKIVVRDGMQMIEVSSFQ